jgi:hypothetical protein
MMNIDDVYDLLREQEEKLDKILDLLETTKDRKEISEYMKDNRSATIFKAKEGYEVDLYEYRKHVETRKVHEHSYEYATNLADNWINKLIKEINNE